MVIFFYIFYPSFNQIDTVIRIVITSYPTTKGKQELYSRTPLVWTSDIRICPVIGNWNRAEKLTGTCNLTAKLTGNWD